jgi:hypothetical protein
MGVATFTQRNEFPIGNSGRLVTGTLTMSNSYATGGDTLDLQGDVGAAEGSLIIGSVAGGRALEWDGTNQKVLAYQDNAAAAAAALGQVANATNLSTVAAECWAILPT